MGYRKDCGYTFGCLEQRGRRPLAPLPLRNRRTTGDAFGVCVSPGPFNEGSASQGARLFIDAATRHDFSHMTRWPQLASALPQLLTANGRG
jgi:hypothetical protein